MHIIREIISMIEKLPKMLVITIKTENGNNTQEMTKDESRVKVVWYLSIIPRLKR